MMTIEPTKIPNTKVAVTNGVVASPALPPLNVLRIKPSTPKRQTLWGWYSSLFHGLRPKRSSPSIWQSTDSAIYSLAAVAAGLRMIICAQNLCTDFPFHILFVFEAPFPDLPAQIFIFHTFSCPMCPVRVGILGSVTGMVPFRIFSVEPVSRLRGMEPGSTYDVINDST
jgi:hypothetical protein